jgi:hypothetical protein
MSTVGEDEARWARAQKLAIKLVNAAGSQEHADMFTAIAFLAAGQLAIRAPTKAEAERKLDEIRDFSKTLINSMWRSKSAIMG